MEYRILGALKQYKSLHPVRFHMPGHQANRKIFPAFKDAALDITELSVSDCLEDPEGVIAEAQNDIAEILGARKSYIVTDGSSAAVMAMLYAARGFGSKLLIRRSSHKSIYNACGLLGIEPSILRCNELNGVLLPPAPIVVEEAFQKDSEVCGILLTSPDYYGNIAEYEKIRKICHQYNKLFMVDGAHGAYLRFDADNNSEAVRAAYAGDFADIWVDGSHKTMPTLTQGALLNVNDERLIPRVEEGLGVFRTTSPSYPIMASVEYGVKYMATYGAKLIDTIKRELMLMQTRLAKRGIQFYPASSTLQFAVDFGGMGISPYLAQEILEKRKIFCEMNDGRYLVFYLTAATPISRLRKLESALRRIAREKSLKNTYEEKPIYTCGVKKFSYLTALTFDTQERPLEKAVGKVCARNLGVTPPCFPLVIAGEVIGKDAVETLSRAKNTFGVHNGTVSVIRVGGKI